MASIIAGLAVAVAVIGGLVSYALDLENRITKLQAIIDTDSMRVSIEAQLKEALQTLENRKNEALADIRNSIQLDTSLKNMKKEVEEAIKGFQPPSLGEWQNLTHGELYQAETDGFVSAFVTGDGDHSHGLLIKIGSDKENLKIRMRGGRRYDGSTVPVAKGDYWIVKRTADRVGDIIVGWLPLSNSHRPSRGGDGGDLRRGA